MKDWVPFLTKLVWPVLIGFGLFIFRAEVSELYDLTLDRIKQGSSVRLGGFFELGEAARETEIQDLSLENLSIETGMGGGVTRKGSRSFLESLLRELEENPDRTINTLLVTDDIRLYSVPLLKEYVSLLNLKYVVFLRSSKFEGWMYTNQFLAQLPESETEVFDELLDLHGIRRDSVKPTDSASEVLATLQEKRLDTIPVVDEDGRWRFFVTQGDILSRLMTSLIVENR